MDSLLTLITATFPEVKWTGWPGEYIAEFPNGYLLVTERIENGLTQGEISFHITSSCKRQIFNFSWWTTSQRNNQIATARSELQAIHNAVNAAFGVT